MNNFISRILFIVAVAMSSTVMLTGCANITPQNVTDAITLAQTKVDQLQASVKAIQDKLATLPPDAPERKALDKTLATLSADLTRAQIDLEIAQAGADIFTPVPATQPAK